MYVRVCVATPVPRANGDHVCESLSYSGDRRMQKRHERIREGAVVAHAPVGHRPDSQAGTSIDIEPLKPVSPWHMIKLGVGLIPHGHFEYISNMFISPLARVLLDNATQVGLVQSFNPLFSVLVQPVVGWRGDHTWTRLGRRKPYLLVALPWILVSLIVMPLTHTLWMFIAAVIVYQFFVDMYAVSCGTMMPETVPLEQRSRQEGVSATLGSLVTVFAILFVGRLYDRDPLYPFALATGITMLSTAVLVFGIREYYRPPKQRPPLYVAPVHVAKAAFSNRNILIMLLILLFSSYGNYSVLMFLTLFMNRTLNVTIGNAVRMSVITYALTAALALPFGNIADRYGKKNAMIFGQIVGIMALLTGLLARSIEHMYLLFVLVAIAQTAFRVTFYPLLTQFMPRDKMGTISGAIPIFFSSARVLASLTAGRIIDAFGENYRVVWPVALACAIPTLAFVLMVDPTYRADDHEVGSAE